MCEKKVMKHITKRQLIRFVYVYSISVTIYTCAKGMVDAVSYWTNLSP